MLAVHQIPRSTLVHFPQFPDPPLCCFLPSVLDCPRQAQEQPGEQAADADEALQPSSGADGLDDAGPSEVRSLCRFPRPMVTLLDPSHTP